jgi:uncharacterized membrane protein (UPF0127 family)
VKVSPPLAPPKRAKQFPASVTKREQFEVPNGIIARLRAEVGGLKLRVEVLEKDNGRISDAEELQPQSQEACGLSNDLSERLAVVRLRGGSRGTGGLSARG